MNFSFKYIYDLKILKNAKYVKTFCPDWSRIFIFKINLVTNGLAKHPFSTDRQATILF